MEGFPDGAINKDLLSSAGDRRDDDSIFGSWRSPGGGHGNPLQYSCLENPMDRGAMTFCPQGHIESDKTEVTEHAGMHCELRNRLQKP